VTDLTPLVIVVAMSKNRCIGKDGELPWHIPEDLKHFRKLTTGHAIIMGRRTHESIGRPLPKRRNIIVTRNREFRAEGCEVAHGLEEAIAVARQRDEAPVIVGGAELYAQALPLTTRIHLTEVDQVVEGDAFFPELVAGEWEEVERSAAESEGVTFVTLARAL